MKKLALVLGGGAVKGFAHIGVIKVLEEHNVRPDLIVGTSMGAIVGGLYATGVNSEKLTKFARDFSFKSITDFSIISALKNGHLYKGKRLEEYVKKIFKETKHEDLEIPFVAVATDLKTGEQVNLDRGLVYKNVLASSAMQAVFPPIKIEGKLLSDGGVKDNVPIKVAKKIMKDAVILSVDVIGNYKKQVETEGFALMIQILNMSTLLTSENTKRNERLSDFNLKITQPEIHQMDFKKETALKAIENGEKAMKEQIQKLKALLR